jgi:hypothetical protein
MISALNQRLEDFMRREAARGKWTFVVRIGFLAWGIPLLCAINWWFHSLTHYPPLKVLPFSLVFWLPSSILLGLGLYRNAQKTPDELREQWLRNLERGEARFVWRYGVLCFGGPMFVAFSILIPLTLRSYPLAMLTFVFAACSILGAAFGCVVWSNLRRPVAEGGHDRRR